MVWAPNGNREGGHFQNLDVTTPFREHDPPPPTLWMLIYVGEVGWMWLQLKTQTEGKRGNNLRLSFEL